MLSKNPEAALSGSVFRIILIIVLSGLTGEDDCIRNQLVDAHDHVHAHAVVRQDLGELGHLSDQRRRHLALRILDETGIERLRISSLQPQEVNRRLIELWQNPRLCRHFHLSLQSGSDGVLKRMKRHYTKDDYRQAVSLISSVAPDAAITTDIIVGFPGETDGEFAESLEFCKEIGFARIHVFSYSARPGTTASLMPGQVGDRVKKERSREMLRLAGESAAAFHKGSLGQTLPVLWEQQADGLWNGLTGNYIRVYIKSDEDLINRITDVKLDKLYKDGVIGSSNR